MINEIIPEYPVSERASSRAAAGLGYEPKSPMASRCARIVCHPTGTSRGQDGQPALPVRDAQLQEHGIGRSG